MIILTSDCANCLNIFKKLNSCPLTVSQATPIYHMLVFANYFFVFLSFFSYFFAFALILKPLIRWRFSNLVQSGLLLMGQAAASIGKHYFQQLRPIGACSSDFGQPSSHSVFAIQIIVWTLFENYYLGKNRSEKPGFVFWTILGWCFLIPISRFFLNYHTFGQIALGIFLGFQISIGGILSVILISRKREFGLGTLLAFMRMENDIVREKRNQQ